MIVLLMGVSGCGKTEVGSRLAERHGISFVEGDDLHPDRNLRKMAAGIPLTDDDRRPWLRAIRKVIEEHAAAGSSAIVACSALKERYRHQLLDGIPDAKLVYLRGSREILAERLRGRTGHFFDPSLLGSQLETLEEPGGDAVLVDADRTLDLVIDSVERAIDPVST